MGFWDAKSEAISPKVKYRPPLQKVPPQSEILVWWCQMFHARSRGSSGRTVCEPMGNLSYESVRTGNYIAVRTLIVLIVVAALQCWTILEQPKNSIMELHPAFQQYLSMVQCWRAHIQMRDYGGPTAKPTWLYSNWRMIGELHEFRPLSLPAPTQPIEMVVRYTDSSGRSKIKGGRHLKQSQSYPKGFLVIVQIAAVAENLARSPKQSLLFFGWCFTSKDTGNRSPQPSPNWFLVLGDIFTC